MSKDHAVGPKGLDGFQIRTIELLSRLSQNPKAIVIGLSLVFGAMAVGYGVSYFVKNKQETRRIELSKVDQAYEAESKDYSNKREEIEKKRDGLKAALNVPANPAGAEADKVETPEIKALNEQIEALKPDHKGSSDQYRDFFRKYPKSPEGLLAGLQYGAYQAEQKQLEEAQKILEEVVAAASPEQSIVYNQSLLLLISVLEDRDQYDKALDYAERYIKVATPDLKPRALLGKAQIYYLKKDFPNAQSTLNQLLSEHANSMEADRARNLLALLPLPG